MVSLPRLVVAAPASGQGKTTIATGLMAALTRKNIRVAPAKVGPDYIDPSYHALATGRPGRNLDPWLVGEELIVPLLLHGAQTPGPADSGGSAEAREPAQLAIIEGVMGLFDGMLGTDGFSSTAHVARLTSSPVLLVVDVSGAARTVAAVVAGLAGFDPDVRIGGVILNRVGSARHAHELTSAVESIGIDVLGCVGRDTRISAPSRHLGLVPTAERADAEETVQRLAKHVGGSVDLDGVIDLALSAPDLDAEPWDPSAVVTPVRAPQRPVIAIAAGQAFTFRYTETEELLRAAGCETVSFDPVSDERLPTGTRALYLGGGFPEVHANKLAANRTLAADIRAHVAAGLPTYAECAGLLYLLQTLDDHPMAGVLPATGAMSPSLTLRYVSATTGHDSLLGPTGTTVRGHEFHRTTTTPGSSTPPAWTVSSSFTGAYPEGFSLDPAETGRPTVHASYLHVHFAGQPGLAQTLAEAAAGFAPPAELIDSTRERPLEPQPSDHEPAGRSHAVAPGEVILVGGGPGDLGLLTVAGLAAIQSADVVVTDRLVPVEALSRAAANAEIIHVGKIPRGAFTPQQQINAILIEHARAGRKVVRLKGGDNFVFGRGGEEWLACTEAGVSVRVIPGVTSSVAAPGLAGIPVTHRNLTQGFLVVSGHVPPGDARSDVNWAGIATAGLTIVVLMGVASLPAIATTLAGHGLDPATPAATIADAGLPSQRVVRGRLDDIADRTREAGIEPPAVTVIGPVVDALHHHDADHGSREDASRDDSASQFGSDTLTHHDTAAGSTP